MKDRKLVNIAHIVRSLELGGLERMAVDLATSQVACGHDVTICCIYAHESPLIEEARAAGVHVLLLNKRPGFSLKTLLSLAKYLRSNQISIVHTHNELVHTYGTIAAHLAHIHCIVNTIHGKKSGEDPTLERNFGLMLPLTSAVVAVSADTAEHLRNRHSSQKHKFHTIRNGIRVDRFRRNPARPGSCWPRIRFGTVGRLAEVKDQATLLRAFQIVQQKQPMAELHLLGDGPLRTPLEQLAKDLKISAGVTFHGLSLDVAEFLSGLDVFVLSSLSEGLPLSVLEAMSSGLPIVSTRVGGIPEVATAGEVAEYCPASNPHLLAIAMLRVLGPERLRDMGEKGQIAAIRQFSVNSMCRQYSELFTSLQRRV